MKKVVKSKSLIILVGIAVALFVGSAFLFLHEAKTDNPQAPSTSAIRSGTSSAAVNKPGAPPAPPEKPALSKVATAPGIPQKPSIPEDAKKNMRHHSGVPTPSVSKTALLTQGFEEGIMPPTGWSVVVNNAYTWHIESYDPYEGTYHAVCFYDEDYTGTQDEWMISPVIDLTTKGENWQLSFYWYASYYWGVDPYDNYELEVWIDTNGDGTFETKLWCEDDVGAFSTFTWYRADVSLAAYLAYDNVKLGFRYYGYDGAEGSFDAISVDTPPIGRCCYGDPYDPDCLDITQDECDALSGTWDYGLNCTDNPCPIPGVGDNCSSPILVNLPAQLPYSDLGQTTCGKGHDYDGITCLGYYDGGEDIIYQLDVASAMNVNIVLDPKADAWTGIAIDGACPPGATCMAYSTNSSASPHGLYGVHLDPGTYWIMIDTWPSPDCITTFDLSITEAGAAPPNDECETAEPVSAPDCPDYVEVSGTTIGATIDCPGVLDWNAVWYEFYLPYASNKLKIDYCPTPTEIWQIGIVVYPAPCLDCYAYIIGSYEWVSCPNGNTGPQVWWSGLPAGTYYLPVAVWDASMNPFMDFVFDACIEPITTPDNDNCAAATPIGDVTELPFSTEAATFDGPGGCQTAPNVWYCYTASCDGMAHIALCGSAYDTKLAVYDGCECNPVGTMLGCNDDACGGTLQSELKIPVYNGQQLLIEVGGYGSNTGPGVLTCSCYVPPAAPPNDNCEDAEVLQDPLPVCPDYQTVYGTTIGATNDCPGVFDWPGVWYTFNLPFTSNNLYVDYCPTNSPDVYTRSIALLNSCDNCAGWIAASLYSWVTCPSGYTDLQMSWKDLPPGQYWLPVLAWDWNYNNMDFGFSICVEEAVPCILECPPGGIDEGEPDCYDGYVDEYNGGCNSPPDYPFQTINCGDTICGTSGVYDDYYYRDTDWFRVEVGDGDLTWTCVAEFPVLIFIMDAGSENCLDYTQLGYNYTYDVCDTISLSMWVPQGVYWLWVGPVDWGNYPCGDLSEYIAWVDCVPFGAQIAVDPASFDLVLNPSGDCSTAEEELVISNEGGEDLNYSIAETPPVDWMELSSYGGTIPAGNQHTLDASFDASGMTPGDYYTDLVITSNDPDNPQVIVPVHLKVEMAPEIDVPSRVWQAVIPECIMNEGFRITNTGEGELRFEISVEKNPPPPAAPMSNPWETLLGAGDARLIDKSNLPLPTIFAPAEVSRSINIPGAGAGKGILTQGIIWDNGMDASYGLLASQRDEAYPFEAIVADDYILDEDMQVTHVDWIGGYWNGPPDDGDFDWEVTFYEDFGDGNKPGTPIATFYFPNAEVNETYISGYNFSYEVDLPTPVECEAGMKYWMSVQGIGYYPPQSGWGAHTSILLHQSVFKAEFFGYPDWTNSETVFGLALDVAFQLTGEPAGPPCPFTVYPEEGTVPAESFFDVTLTYDGTLYEQCIDDTLMCYLWITSNDCDEPLLVVDVLATSARGDVQREYCVINSADLVFLINYVFKGGPAPDPYCMGDVDRDDDVDSDDVLYLLSYLFLYGPPPEIPAAPEIDQTIRPMR